MRLVLRQWRDEDWAPFAALNADPEVMRHFPSTLDEQESNAFAYRNAALLEVYGYGLWAVEVARVRRVPRDRRPQPTAVDGRVHAVHRDRVAVRRGRPGATGMRRRRLAPPSPWRSVRSGLDEVVSFTTVANTRSRAVMERLGMTRDPAEDFDHPKLDPDSPVRTHVLYRLRADRFDGGRLPASGRLVGPAR